MVAIDTQNVNRAVVTTEDLKIYKIVLQLLTLLRRDTNLGNVQISRGTNFRDEISKLFPRTRRPRGVDFSLRQHWERCLHGWKVII